jgi:hypothetical protein
MPSRRASRGPPTGPDARPRRDGRAIIPAKPRRGAKPTGVGPLDIIFLVERLESLIANGKPLPLTRNAIIDRDAALNLIDELRVAVPEEVRAAKRINQEGERIIEKAQEEAERIVGRAQEQAAYLIEERGLTEAAEDESRRILAGADEEAGAVRAGADDYATGVLSDLRSEVARALNGIERGIAMLDERRAAHLQAQHREPEPGAGVDDDGYEAEAYHEDQDEEEGASTVSRR